MAEATGNATREQQKTNQDKVGPSQNQKRPAWGGNRAEDFSGASIRERTFSIRLPMQFEAKDVLMSINGVIVKEDVETVSKQSTPRNWTIVTKSIKGANKLDLNTKDTRST